MTLTPYLLFDGNCRQAMEFYNSCFGGQLTSTTTPDGRILNAHLESDTADISASDWLRADRTAVRGNTVCLYLNGLRIAVGDGSDGVSVALSGSTLLFPPGVPPQAGDSLLVDYTY